MHTNGIFSFNADLPFRKQRRYHSPEECLKIAARHGCVCCPGEQWHYSNTGYVLLGLIVERIEGRPLDEVFHNRIIEPLGLRETIAIAPRKARFAGGRTRQRQARSRLRAHHAVWRWHCRRLGSRHAPVLECLFAGQGGQ